MNHVNNHSAFGSVCILGEDNDNVIAGYFVFRGTEIPFEVKDCADYDSYSFTKADHTNKQDQEKVNAFFAWDDVIEGKTCVDGKVFK
jgi:elongation factor 1-gamma